MARFFGRLQTFFHDLDIFRPSAAHRLLAIDLFKIRRHNHVYSDRWFDLNKDGGRKFELIFLHRKLL